MTSEERWWQWAGAGRRETEQVANWGSEDIKMSQSEWGGGAGRCGCWGAWPVSDTGSISCSPDFPLCHFHLSPARGLGRKAFICGDFPGAAGNPSDLLAPSPDARNLGACAQEESPQLSLLCSASRLLDGTVLPAAPAASCARTPKRTCHVSLRPLHICQEEAASLGPSL